MFRDKNAAEARGQCSRMCAPGPPASESPERLLESQVTTVHRQVCRVSAICISVSFQVVLRHPKVWEPSVCSDGAATGSIPSLRKLWGHKKKQVAVGVWKAVRSQQQWDSNAVLGRRARPFSVGKDRCVVKALIFATEAVPYCFPRVPHLKYRYANSRPEPDYSKIITNMMK